MSGFDVEEVRRISVLDKRVCILALPVLYSICTPPNYIIDPMMSSIMAVTLAEPAVLAAAKDTRYPDIDAAPDWYTVTETQFTQSIWDGWIISDWVRDRLAPCDTNSSPGAVTTRLS